MARVVDPPDREGTSAEQLVYNEALSNEVEYLKRLRLSNIVKIYSIPWGTRKASLHRPSS